MLESIEYSFANTHFEYSSNKAIWDSRDGDRASVCAIDSFPSNARV